MGQEENTELRDNMEDLEDKIAEEQDRKRAAEEKLLSRNKLLAGIREGLEKLTEKLVSHKDVSFNLVMITCSDTNSIKFK